MIGATDKTGFARWRAPSAPLRAGEGGCPRIKILAREIARKQKSGPIAGATFQEVRFGRLSGKAMEVTVSQGGTALRELVTGNASEGHFFGFAAS